MIEIKSRFGDYRAERCSVSDLDRLSCGDTYLVTDEHLAYHYPKLLADFASPIVVPAGESSKSPAMWTEVVERLAKAGATRRSTVVAFGGGVVGDLAGFAAATYMRGIRWLMVPTSLLAMVDSSIGGKVGIDLSQGKNLVGAFHPPSQVLLAPELLRTLPERHFWNGMAEVIKTAFILDAALAERLESEPVCPESLNVDALIFQCLAHKATVVQSDELETTGLRAILNFGHTVGHAIEKELKYETLLHGEAVAVGMVVEATLGELLGVTKSGTTDRLRSVLVRHQLPTALPCLLAKDRLIATMRLDKKASKDGIAMSLLTGVGTCKLVQNVSESEILRALHEIGFA